MSNLLKYALNIYTKEDLKDYAKQLNLRRISSYNKSELAEKIANELMMPDVMRKKFSVLTDEQIKLFEKAMEEPLEVEESQFRNAEVLDEIDYAYLTDDDFLVVPDDVKIAYGRINTPEFHEYRKKMVWLKQCLDISKVLYGIVPVDIIVEIYNGRPRFHLDKESIMKLFNAIPEEEQDFILMGDNLIGQDYLEENNYKALLNMQADKRFYIPGYRQVLDYAQNEYLTDEKAYQELKAYISSHLNGKEITISDLLVEDVMKEIWQQFCLGYDFQDVIEWICVENRIIHIDGTLEQMNDFLKILQNASNNTRMLINRGNTPEEIRQAARANWRNGKMPMPTIVPGSSRAAKMLKESEEQLMKMGLNVDFNSNVDEISVTTYPKGIGGPSVTSSRKIYPNDPCPCGSGKKYKKCCGR